FLLVALVMTHNLADLSTDSKQEEFESEELNIAIIDQDGATLGAAMETYFGKTHNLKDLEYDEEAILNELYWRAVDYVLIIPEGFEDSLLSDDTDKMELQGMKVPGMFNAVYFESEVELYTSKLTGLLAAGYSIEEGEAELLNLQEKKTKVTIASFVNADQHDAATVFFVYVPYLFLSLGMTGVGTVLLRFNEKEVKARMECGAMTIKKRIIGLTAAVFAFGLIMLAVVLAAAGILSKGSIYTDARFPYFLLNLFALLLFSLSLGFFTGSISKNRETINGIVNVAGLVLCFLGGVFVPMEFFSDGVNRVAKFFPTYWYVVTNDSIGAMKTMSPELLGKILPQIGLVFCYALAIFAAAVVVISNRKTRMA
ncbi:MAG: ABC transporter permease, partial [Lachnospiraceae bacterium]|nr:ABC transporter permease [Lachnospiraceae bacterium]